MSKAWLLKGLLVTFLLAGTATANASTPPPGTPDEDEAETADVDGWRFHVGALEQYRFRHATAIDGLAPPLVGAATDDDDEDEGGEAESDQDIRLFLYGGVQDPSDRFAADLSLALWADVDGVPDDDDASAFGSIYDQSGQIWFDIYTLSAEYRSPGVLALARGGRQTTEHGIPATFDGASLRLRAVGKQLEFFMFGGRTVHFFEADADIFEDWMASAGAVIRPHEQVKIELDYRFLLEDTDVEEDLVDHSYGAALWFRHADWLYLKAFGRGVNDHVSHVGANANFEWRPIDFGANVHIAAQPMKLGELAEEEDPYFSILGESLPHLRTRVDVWKAFPTHAGTFTLHVGWAGRMLLGDDPTRFNRDYGRVYLLFEARDLGVKGPFVTLAGEYHYTLEADELPSDDLFTVGGSAGYASHMVRAEVGTYYQRFKYEYFRDAREVEDVRTVFAAVQYRPLRWLSLRARYEYEQSFARDWHTVTFALAQTY